MSTRSVVNAADTAAVATVQQQLGLPSFMATALVARGIDAPQVAREFLDPSLDRDWFNPYQIPGMHDVVDALERAVRQRQRIMVFGDFDLDGISATTVLTRGLRALGSDAVPFIPRRSSEGYGITEAAIERCMLQTPDVLVTVDCGISCRDEVKLLQRRGVEVLVTDHHEPAELVPEGVPLCNPKLDPESPCTILAGVGVALSCVQALGARFGQPHLWRELTDLAALGTIADLMPMVGANRSLVADGVARMNEAPRPAIAALLATAGVAGQPVAANGLSFSVIPRLNAAGRMGDAQLALDLLLTDDFDCANEKAAELEAVNDARRSIESELAEIAGMQAEEIYHGQRALVVSGAGWHEGVKGIVASRLVRTYGVPVLLFTIDEDGSARGSGRSVGQVNLFKAVESCSDLLTRFGGHDAAVGVTLPAKDLPAFTERLCAYMDELPDDNFHARIDIDAVVDLSELTLDNVKELSRMAPFGQENSTPVFLAQDVMLTKARAVGADKNHFSCMLTNGRTQISGIMFHCSDIETLLRCDSIVNAAFEVQIDEWRGRESVKAMINSLEPATPCAAMESWLDPETTAFVDELYATSDAELVADDVLSTDEAKLEEAEAAANRSCWEWRAKEDPEALRAAVVSAFIGSSGLLPAQAEVLQALGRGESVLAVMATGRGKSLTFQVHAALRALQAHEASLFVYPLRALIADQAFHLREALSPFGLGIEVLTGESTPEERKRILEGLEDGTVDIIATTPEFLSFHADELARSGRIRFAVVDEAHHVGLSKAGNRPAYAQLGKAFQRLGNPVVLALTATADARVAADIERTLGISRRVLDHAVRSNMRFDDQRNLSSRDQYLASIIASGEKTVIYVNSRASSVTLARTLRSQVPHVAPFIGFYNAGLSRRERKRVEEMFRRGTLTVLVSTSAFGEGVNIPDIRHVVLYHMPFNEVEFNQMSGRAGRDGNEAFVHALFGEGDAGINESILTASTPGHDTMAQVYRELRSMGRERGGTVSASNADLAEACSARNARHQVSQPSVECAVAVFRELGLIETRPADGPDRPRSIRVVETENKCELTDSVRYREGLDEIDIFRDFSAWVRTSTSDVLRNRIIAPILPIEDEEGND
ncbi:MAG: single-stranded-DNA-specific exonuclease RecJ [Eggerthellaceae bacterium]|nr:single-stranded-DNA-specific exonuclease RecJ [Eggerthellaceae bacterium]